jgi:hypothetical protein
LYLLYLCLIIAFAPVGLTLWLVVTSVVTASTEITGITHSNIIGGTLQKAVCLAFLTAIEHAYHGAAGQ